MAQDHEFGSLKCTHHFFVRLKWWSLALQDCIDRLLIGVAVIVYALVVLWILYRRLGIRRIVEFFAPLLPYIGSDWVRPKAGEIF